MTKWVRAEGLVNGFANVASASISGQSPTGQPVVTQRHRQYLRRYSPVPLMTLLSVCSYPANAQDVLPPNPNPPQRMIDVNNVDVTSSAVSVPKTLVAGGDQTRPLAAAVNIRSLASGDDPSRITIEPKYNVAYTGRGLVASWATPLGNFVFKLPSGWPNTPPAWALGSAGIGAFFVENNGGVQKFVVVDRAGNRLTGATSLDSYVLTYADGETWTYYYATLTYPAYPNGSPNKVLKFVVSSRGYGIQFSYDNSANPNYTGGALSRVTFYNKSFVYCNETLLLDCPIVSSLPTAGTISRVLPPGDWGTQTYASSFNQGVGSQPINYSFVQRITYAAPGEQGLKVLYGAGGDGQHDFMDVLKLEKAGVPSSTRTYSYAHLPGNDGFLGISGLYSASDGSKTWAYSIPDSVDISGAPFVQTGSSATDPDGRTYAGSAVNMIGTFVSFTDALQRSWAGAYDGTNFRLTGVQNPELDWIAYTYDGRGNVTEERRIPKGTSSLPENVRSANYAASCINYLTCNKPNWIKDFKGNQTDLTYDPSNGNVLTVTSPADGNGVRPQKRYTYVQRYALILDSGGGYIQASTPVWMRESESYCRNSAATGSPSSPCAGNDEVKTVYDYGPSAGVPNNLFLRGVAVTAGGVTLRTCYGNDRNGRRIWTTSPRANKTSCS